MIDLETLKNTIRNKAEVMQLRKTRKLITAIELNRLWEVLENNLDSMTKQKGKPRNEGKNHRETKRNSFNSV